MTAAPLRISIHSGRSGPQRIALRSSRPVLAARVLESRSAAEVMALLPRLYSVCAMAQLSAGRRALNDAAGLSFSREEALGDQRSMLLETAREHLWRVLLDWPALLDDAPAPQNLAALRELTQQLRSGAQAVEDSTCPAAELTELLRSSVFEHDPLEWCRLDREALKGWSEEADSSAARLVRHLFEQGWQDAGATEPRFLPSLSPADLDRRLSDADSDDFVCRPEWDGHTCETTPLSRQRGEALVSLLLERWGAGALTRVVALLVELARIPGQLSALSGQTDSAAASGLPDHTGLAQVDAARGRLVHRAVLAGQRVQRYQVLAPTEWNCHPQGVLARSLAALDSRRTETLKKQAALLITAIDPCVGYSLEVH